MSECFQYRGSNMETIDHVIAY